MATPFLTKSRFMSGMQCEKALWLSAHRPEMAATPSAGRQRLFDQGHEVGLLAWEHVPGGVAIEAPGFRDAVDATADALRHGASIVYEASFAAGPLGAKIDVLRKTGGDAWEIIEVKASTSVKAEHVPDVAFQTEVVERAGLPVEKATLMHVNNRCMYPDLSDVFRAQDVTEDVRAVQGVVIPKAQRLLQVLASPNEPSLDIGSHCDKPYACAFKEYCWQHVPKTHSIFSVPGIRSKDVDALVREGIVRAAEIPEKFLTPARRKYVELILGNVPRIDRSTIRRELNTLSYPIHFLDFESISGPIPRFDGTRPYQQVPFQYSCHTLDEDGNLTESAYLHLDADDPRPPLARSLAYTIGGRGSIVVYNEGFERGILKDLALFLPELEPALAGMVDRLWDLLPIFRNHYAHPGFNGSNSIKNVLPVVVPDLTYEGLVVADGETAQAAWEVMLRSDGDERDRLAGALRAYCRLDTLAMVRILEHLRAIADIQASKL